MPVRSAALDTAIHTILEGHSYYFMNIPGDERAFLDGKEMPKDEFNRRFSDPIERIYERIVDSIDWNRVMLEAGARHQALMGTEEHKRCEKFAADQEFGFGPECLCEALMADDTILNWERQPKSPRYHREHVES